MQIFSICMKMQILFAFDILIFMKMQILFSGENKKTNVINLSSVEFVQRVIKTQSNRVSSFRDFVCSLFPKAIFFFF